MRPVFPSNRLPGLTSHSANWHGNPMKAAESRRVAPGSTGLLLLRYLWKRGIKLPRFITWPTPGAAVLCADLIKFYHCLCILYIYSCLNIELYRRYGSMSAIKKRAIVVKILFC